MRKHVFINNNMGKIQEEIQFPDFCPICGKNTNPTFLYGHTNDDESEYMAAVFQDSCGGIFLGFYKNYSDQYILQGTLPRYSPKKLFSDDIQRLFPDFVEIYHQSEEAENYNLIRICGMGYRKAIEFLVKDYCLMLNPNSKDSILKETLIKSIERLDNHLMVKLANKCRLLGNDETHIVTRYAEGVKELKLFISSLVNTVQSQLDAEKMLHPNE